MRKKATLFDFDGTLADTVLGIQRTMQETFKAMSLPIPPDEEIRATIGLPLYDSLKSLNNLSDEKATEATNLYHQLFPKFEVTYVTIFPEVKETLEWLASQGVRMAIVTSRNVESLDLINSSRGINDYFETRITASDNLPSKPAPDMVYDLLERMKLEKEDVIVVGDTTFDIDMGNSAGCETVAVTYGNHTKEHLLSSKPDHIIDRFSELKNILK